MKQGVWLAFLDNQNGNPSRKGGKTIDLYCYIKASVSTDDLIPKTRRCRNQHSMAFQTPIADTDVYKGSFFPFTIRDWNPSPILWSHLLKMQRIVMLISFLWWELGTNSLITGRFGVSPVNYPDPDPDQMIFISLFKYWITVYIISVSLYLFGNSR